MGNWRDEMHKTNQAWINDKGKRSKGDSISKPVSQAYRDNYDNIFRKDKDTDNGTSNHQESAQ